MKDYRWLSCVVVLVLVFGRMLHVPTLFSGDGGVNGNNWQALPGPTGGFVGNLSLSPNFATDHTLYAAAGRSGVYRSTDGGSSWAIVGTGQLCGS